MAGRRHQYSIEIEREAVRLVEEEGLSYAQVGRDLGLDRQARRRAGRTARPQQARGQGARRGQWMRWCRDMAGTDDALAHEAVAWDGELLDAELAVLGAPRFRLHMLPQRASFQVHAQLWDVAEDGRAELISRGHFATRTATPGRHVLVEIEGRPIAWRVAAGHRLRVVVCNYDTTYAFPFYEPFSARLYQERDRPSAVTVPVEG